MYIEVFLESFRIRAFEWWGGECIGEIWQNPKTWRPGKTRGMSGKTCRLANMEPGWLGTWDMDALGTCFLISSRGVAETWELVKI